MGVGRDPGSGREKEKPGSNKKVPWGCHSRWGPTKEGTSCAGSHVLGCRLAKDGDIVVFP